MSAHQYRKRPVVFEAFRVTPKDTRTSLIPPPWLVDALVDKRVVLRDDGGFTCDTLKGRVLDGKSGDWIIRGVEGEIYPCDDSIFRKTYEPVDPGADPL